MSNQPHQNDLFQEGQSSAKTSHQVAQVLQRGQSAAQTSQNLAQAQQVVTQIQQQSGKDGT